MERGWVHESGGGWGRVGTVRPRVETPNPLVLSDRAAVVHGVVSSEARRGMMREGPARRGGAHLLAGPHHRRRRRSFSGSCRLVLVNVLFA